MTYRMLLILALLLALPFSLKVRAQYPGDTTEVTWEGIADEETRVYDLDEDSIDAPIVSPEDIPEVWGKDITISTPTHVVYYFDTVGFNPHHENRFEGDAQFSITVWTPIIDTIIVARFWTADTKRIEDWRVMEAK